ncbi:endonuclease/exonuclease/phosphatase family protein [Anaeramoeba ignava]|uniref:Endonuclease/exonuclease/phosphatase family protein n=1 Tax=Anaeramoeba ignava TaxID=1746090 RepID=A0A9Q0LE23_ANAIG|nr:endonuclease/exonuclease/phosphatase family protein [Anaeramoeba ignava]
MKLIVVIVFLTFLFSVRPQTFDCNTLNEQGDRRADKTKFRVCSFNVKFLFDGINDSSTGSPWDNATVATYHLQNVTKVIEQINCDFLSLYEVEDCSILSRIIDLLPAGFGYNYYLVKGKDYSTKQQTALLTRVDPVPFNSSVTDALLRTDYRVWYPVNDSQCGYTGTGSDYGVSKNQYALFNVGGKEILFVAAHLRAFPTTAEPCALREAQALVLRNLAETEGFAKGREIMLMGDLNDYSDAVPDINNDQPTSRVLRFLREGQYGSNNKLINTATKMSQDMRYSAWWDKNSNDVNDFPGEDTQIDHILFTQNLLNCVENAFIYHSPNLSYPFINYNSDHYPVVIDLDLSKINAGSLISPILSFFMICLILLNLL